MDITKKIKAGAYESKIPPVQLPVEVTNGGNETLLAAYNTIASERKADVDRLERQFMDEALASVGLREHPRAKEWYILAWDLTLARGEPTRSSRLSMYEILQKFAALLVE